MKTLDDIAKKCGVSAMTVSRVLRNKEPVKESTRRKILAVAGQSGYLQGTKPGRPSAVSGVRSSVDVVLGVFGRCVPAFHLELLTAIEQSLARRGWDCVVRTCNGEYDQFMVLREALRRSAAVDTMIVGNFRTDQLKALVGAVPGVLLVDHPGDAAIGSGYESISFDNVEAARIAVRHLLSIGRKRILLVRGPVSHFFSREIEQGYRDALGHGGLQYADELIVEADFTAEGSFAALETAMAQGVSFDAVFTNDEMAVGVYRTLNQRGVAIPGKVAVCGCDGLQIGKQLFPALTTVLLDYGEMGRMAVLHLLKPKEERRLPCRTRLIPRLEKRDSA